LWKHVDFSQQKLFTTYGPVATMVPPRLLSMAVEIFTCQAGTANLVHAPDWTRNWVDDPRFRRHPLYIKTLRYEAAHAAGRAHAIAAGPVPAGTHAIHTVPTLTAGPADIPAPPSVQPAPAAPDAGRQPGVLTPPQIGSGRKRTMSGSSSMKESGRTSPKRRKFKVSPKSKSSTFKVSPKSKVSKRTKRVTRSKSKQPAQSKAPATSKQPATSKEPAKSNKKAKSKQKAKSKEIFTDTDDEDRLPAVGNAPRYIDVSGDDADAGAGTVPVPPVVQNEASHVACRSPFYLIVFSDCCNPRPCECSGRPCAAR